MDVIYERVDRRRTASVTMSVRGVKMPFSEVWNYGCGS